MGLTITQFAELNKIEYPMANMIVQYLAQLELAEVVGYQKSSTGKGKPSKIYKIPDEVTLKFKVSK